MISLDILGLILSKLENRQDVINVIFTLAKDWSDSSCDWSVKHLKYVIPRNVQLNYDDFRSNGCTELIPEIHRSRIDIANIDLAVERNANLSIIKFYHSQDNIYCTTESMDKAAELGRLDIVEFLHFNRSEGCTWKAMDLASINGHLDIVKFLHFNRSEGCSVTTTGNAEIVKFLQWNRPERCTCDALSLSAESGDLDIVEFLYRRYLWKERDIRLAVDVATENNHIDIIEFLNNILNDPLISLTFL